MAERLTPMLKQYRQLKARYPKALLFYRLGDFYELFEEDAKIAAKALGLVLTSRRFSKEVRLPMAGVPHHHVDHHIARLIDRGYMVAVADQLEDSRHAKGLVKRGVTRVVTPGTVMDDSLLRGRVENFLAAVAVEARGRGDGGPARAFGLALVDISTGEFMTTTVDGAEARDALFEELARARPREAVLPPALLADERFCRDLRALQIARLSPLEETDFEPGTCAGRLRAHFQVASLEAFGCDETASPLAVAAAGAALHYLKIHQLSDLAHLDRLSTYHLAEHMALDRVTRRNLELVEPLRGGAGGGTLFGVLNQTQTAMGARLLRRWLLQPLLTVERIRARLDAVACLVDSAFLRHDLRAVLNGMYDVERLVGRIGYGNANGRDLNALKRILKRVPAIKDLLGQVAERPELLAALDGDLDPLADVAGLIERAIIEEPPILITEGGLIKPAFDPDLAALLDEAAAGRAWLAEYEAGQRERTGIKNLRIKYNQVFGFFIEVTRSNLKRVPDDYERRATVTNAERFITPELKAKEALIIAAEDRAKALEYDLFSRVRAQVAAESGRLRRTAAALAALDALAALAEVAARYGYVKPVVDDTASIQLDAARHPVVERTLPGEQPFVPNDCRLDEGQRLLVLTGPNMSGKSVYIRQVALAVLLAQMGSFVPAGSARIGLVDRIFVRAGASDDISQGRSTFLVEMSETGQILRHAGRRSLVILDEVGRGTSTYDGMALAWAVAEDIHTTLETRCLFATHYHELTALGQRLPHARNYTMAVHEREGEVIFLRRVIEGGADRSYGIHVARLAGLPQRVVEKATQVLHKLEAQRGPDLASAVTAGSGHLPPPEKTGPVRETPALYTVTPPVEFKARTLVSMNEEVIWGLLGELLHLDIANLTPVQALVRLNRWQMRLRDEVQGE
ncbi:MAG: DNA mismatch repair protein MutS [Anaerolineae bacterium]